MIEKTLRSAYADCTSLIKAKKCAPILVRLAWHDSGNYDRAARNGGAVASIRFDKELAHGGNAGLGAAVALLAPLKDKYPEISHADLIQMASAAAIEACGGPKIPMRYGRVDAKSDEEVPVEGRLPDGAAQYVRLRRVEQGRGGGGPRGPREELSRQDVGLEGDVPPRDRRHGRARVGAVTVV